MLKGTKKFNKNVVSFLVCLAIAIGLWCYVAFVENPDMTRWITGVPINISGSDALREKGLSIQSLSIDRVDVKVRATRSQFRYISSDTVTVTADVSRISHAGMSSIPLSISLPSSTSDASVVDRRHRTVSIVIEELVEKEFDIELDISKQPSDGYYTNSFSYDTASKVIVSGSATAVSSVAGVKTAPIDLSQAKTNVVCPASLNAYDANGKAVNDVEFSLEKVNITFELYRRRDLPVTLTYKTSNPLLTASVSPETVTVSGPAALIDAQEAILTEGVDAAARSGGDIVSVPLSVPSGLSLGDASPICEVSFKSNQ